MPRFVFAVPVLPGRNGRDVPRVFEGRMAEYEQSRAGARITMERVYEQPTPMGTFSVVYIESETAFAEGMRAMATSGLAIDRDFLAAIAEVHGADPAMMAAAPPPEVIAEWGDPEVTVRRRGLAFAFPLLPGRGDDARAFGREAFVTRGDELVESRRALGQCLEVVTLNQTPNGDLVCVYLEGNDPVEANRDFAASQRPYDVWFKQQLAPLTPPQIDFNQPIPTVEQIWDWHRASVTA